MAMKSRSCKVLRMEKVKRVVEEGTSHHINAESIISGESTPSEFPIVKNAVKFLLK